MTRGCTKQACAYRDQVEKWKKLGIEVVGISEDQPSNLSLFKKVAISILLFYPIPRVKLLRFSKCQLEK